MDQQEFLSYVIGEQTGLLCLAKIDGGRMAHKWVSYPSPVLDDPEWPYFLPALFATQDGPGIARAISANVDHSENLQAHVTPSISVSSSPARGHAYWLTDVEITLDEAQSLARRLAPQADPSPYMRLPGLFNSKYSGIPHLVEVVRAPLTSYQVSSFRRLPDPNGTALKDLLDWNWDPAGMGPLEFVKKLKDSGTISGIAARILASPTGFDLALDLVGSLKIPEEQKIFLLKSASSNPYKNSPDEIGRESAKALARWTTQRILLSPYMEEIQTTRKNRNGPAFIRHDKISAFAISELKTRGIFLHTTDDEIYYVDQETGDTVSLTQGSEKLKYLITSRLHINPIDSEHRHIKEEILAHVSLQPATAQLGDLGLYDSQANQVSIYMGGQKVIRLTKTGASEVLNGDNEQVYRLPSQFEPIAREMVDLTGDYSGWWEDFYPGLPNLMMMSQEHASALLRVWMTFIFFQNAAAARPLLVFLGAHGSGKTTMLTAIYRLIYGTRMECLKLGTSTGFDTALSNHTLAFFDNVDTSQPWLNEKLATAIARMSDAKRKLYTDNDLYTVTNRALVGITSRNPPFLQEDIVDRMLYFSLIRFEDMNIPLKPERNIYSRITANRHKYLSGLIQDAWKVIKTPRHSHGEITWRIADFVDIGAWIAEALGIEKPFLDGIATLRRQQRGLTAEADQLLISALENYAQSCRSATSWKSATDLWEDLLLYASDDAGGALKSKYKNAASLGRKLFSIIGIIKTVVPLEYEIDERTTFKKWRISPSLLGKT